MWRTRCGEPVADYDPTVRAVQQAIGEMPATAFAAPEHIAEAVTEAIHATDSPLRLAIGTAGAHSMRTALDARMRDLDSACPAGPELSHPAA